MSLPSLRITCMFWLVSCAALLHGCTFYDESVLPSTTDGVTVPPDADDARPNDSEASVPVRDSSVDASLSADGGSIDADANLPEAADCDSDCKLCDTCPVVPTCTDGIKNGNETEIDCGGDCPADTCAIGSSCTMGATCKSRFCRGAVCTQDSALRFFGDQAMRFKRPAQDDFTIEFWVNTTQSITGTNWWDGGYLVQADVEGNQSDYGSSVLNGKFAFGTGKPDMTLISTTTINTGKWTHVAASRVRATGVVTIFVNAVQEDSKTSGNTASLTASSYGYIGSDRLSAPGYVGAIDEVRVWNSARTAAEIANTMNKRLRGDEMHLVAYWRMDDAEGMKFLDSSPSKNDGVWLNSTPPERMPSGVPLEPSP